MSIDSGAPEDLSFRRRLTALHEVSTELLRTHSFDALCRTAVRLGRSRLGFDRLGIWFADAEKQNVYGSFGIDETGNVRDERGRSVPLNDATMASIVGSGPATVMLYHNMDLGDDEGTPMGKGDFAEVAIWDGQENIGFIGLDNLLSQRPISKDDCELLALFAVAFGHVSLQLRGEEALRRSEQRFRRLFDDAPVGYHELDAEGRITRVNHTELEMLGYRESEMLGQPAWRFNHDQDTSRHAVDRELRGETSAGRPTERVVVRKDGSLLPVLIQNRVLRDDAGQIVGIRSTMQDITERKEAERQIQQLNLELEHRVDERTAELTALNRELESFSYSVSHDLRAPLRAIDGFSRAISEDCDEALHPQLRSHLERIQAATARMGQLIDDLLALSRVTRVEMRRRPTDLAAIARSIAADLQAAHPERRGEFSIAHDLRADCDANLVRIVLENLLGNAWKFTARRDHARIELGRREENRKQVFFVKDNGTGFDPRYTDRLFTPFQRLHQASEFPGHGIGLATAQRIILRHGGRIWAEAEADRGATFCFTL